jgi:hypothetical protein
MPLSLKIMQINTVAWWLLVRIQIELLTVEFVTSSRSSIEKMDKIYSGTLSDRVTARHNEFVSSIITVDQPQLGSILSFAIRPRFGFLEILNCGFKGIKSSICVHDYV